MTLLIMRCHYPDMQGTEIPEECMSLNFHELLIAEDIGDIPTTGPSLFDF